MSSAAVPATRMSEADIRRQRRRQQNRQVAVRLVLLVLALAYALFPIIWIVSASLDPRNSLVNLGLIPQGATLKNYETLLSSEIHPFTRWLWNSIKVSTITMVLSVLVSTFAAYAFSRFRFRGRDATLLTVFLIQVFPNSLTIVATFLLIQEIGNYIPSLGLNAHGGLILVYLGGALGGKTPLMKGVFRLRPARSGRIRDDRRRVELAHLLADSLPAGAPDPGCRRHPDLYQHLQRLHHRADAAERRAAADAGRRPEPVSG